MRFTHDVIVIGAGAAGLTAAGGCAQLGLRVALVERGAMGGDCLNTGCVPSKALLAAAHRAAHVRAGTALGVRALGADVDFAGVMAHVRGAIAAIAPADSAERMRGMGCEVIAGEAAFTGPASMVVGGRVLTAPRIVLAVGSRPRVPDVPGLADVPFLTNETIFDLKALPGHLLVMGNGPVGLEMAQAFRRLGARVTVVGRGRALARDDADAAALAVAALAADGVEFVEGEVAAVRGMTLRLADGREIAGSHLLVAVGRSHDFAALRLEAAGIAHGDGGIVVDGAGRTTNRRVYAIGDCRPGPRFTHVSGHEGGNMVLAVGLGLPVRADYRALPWVTYTDPEVAQAGMTEAEAREKHGDGVRVWREDFAENDRAIAEGDTRGFVKLVTRGRKLLGATIVGRRAGDLILPAALAIKGQAGLFGLATAIVPYPNRSEHLKKAAFASRERLVFNPLTRWWAARLARLRRLAAG